LTETCPDKRLQLVGIDYKECADNARRFLGRYGNPFGIVASTGNGPRLDRWVFTACRKPSWWGAGTATISTSWSFRSRLTTSTLYEAEIDKGLK